MLPYEREELPKEIQQKIDLDSLRVQKTHTGGIKLPRGHGETQPRKPKKPAGGKDEEEKEPLSAIIRELNDRSDANLTEDDKVSIRNLEEALAEEPAIEQSIQANIPDNARLTFDQIARDRFQEMVENNFELDKRVTDDPAFREVLFDWLFERFRERVEEN